MNDEITPDVAAATTNKPAATDSGPHAEIIGQIEKMTVLELADFVKALEERFGVSAVVPMIMPSPTTAGDVAPVEEQSSFNVVLNTAGDQKIAVIKALREFRADLGLKEAKDLVDTAPKTVLENAKKEDAQAAKVKLEAAGATVELK